MTLSAQKAGRGGLECDRNVSYLTACGNPFVQVVLLRTRCGPALAQSACMENTWRRFRRGVLLTVFAWDWCCGCGLSRHGRIDSLGQSVSQCAIGELWAVVGVESDCGRRAASSVDLIANTRCLEAEGLLDRQETHLARFTRLSPLAPAPPSPRGHRRLTYPWIPSAAGTIFSRGAHLLPPSSNTSRLPQPNSAIRTSPLRRLFARVLPPRTPQSTLCSTPYPLPCRPQSVRSQQVHQAICMQARRRCRIPVLLPQLL